MRILAATLIAFCPILASCDGGPAAPAVTIKDARITLPAVQGRPGALKRDAVPRPEPLRGASEPFARWLAEEVSADLGTTWGLGEGGATGPSGNPYGDPPGHCWLAVHGPAPATRHLLTGDDRRLDNMVAFATAALGLLAEQLER